jgi:hypothetical protein
MAMGQASSSSPGLDSAAFNKHTFQDAPSVDTASVIQAHDVGAMQIWIIVYIASKKAIASIARKVKSGFIQLLH